MATTPKNDSDTMARRDFLKKTGTVAGAAAVGFPGIISGQSVTNALKIGLIGAGGRGRGAAEQALNADPNNELTAIAEIDDALVTRAISVLKGRPAIAARVKVDPANAVHGLDAYEKVINSGVDVVLLATPPGFRPQHLAAAVAANKHIFAEKPCATDAPGVREVIASQKLAQSKNLACVSGFCWRHHHMITAAVQKVHEGAIGRPIAHYGTYYTSPVKLVPANAQRPAGMSDIEWQIRWWYNYTWMSGDSLVEQAVHNADKIMWIKKDEPPQSAVGVGGRSVPFSYPNGGNIYDHFAIAYVWPDGYRAFLANRQNTGTYNATHDYIMGTEGTLTLGAGPARINALDGSVKWQYSGPQNDMYQEEHNVMFASIRAGKPRNTDWNLATSTMLALLGREAAYSGQQLTWDQVLNSSVRILPTDLKWTGSHDAGGPPQPGRYKAV
jgi:predicted dehydrogenase